MRGDCIYINKKRTDHWLTGINTSARTHSGPLVVDSFNLSNIIADETDLGKLKKDNPTHYSIRISIHAPTKGATNNAQFMRMIQQHISIHAPVKGETWPYRFSLLSDIMKLTKDVIVMLLAALYVTIALFVFMFFVNIGVRLLKLVFRLLYYLVNRFILDNK